MGVEVIVCVNRDSVRGLSQRFISSTSSRNTTKWHHFRGHIANETCRLMWRPGALSRPSRGTVGRPGHRGAAAPEPRQRVPDPESPIPSDPRVPALRISNHHLNTSLRQPPAASLPFLPVNRHDSPERSNSSREGTSSTLRSLPPLPLPPSQVRRVKTRLQSVRPHHG
jgi:hypothetical protein